jgi:hypothetical protein
MSETTTVTLTANKTPLTFNVSTDNQKRLIDELTATNKVQPMNNFLARTIDKNCKEGLKPFLVQPTVVMQLGEKLVEKVSPAIKITVGE